MRISSPKESPKSKIDWWKVAILLFQKPFFVSLLFWVFLCQAVVWGKSDDYRLGLRALEDGHVDAAIIALDSYLNFQPGGSHRAEAQFFLAEAYLDDKKLEKARMGYLIFLKGNPEHPFSFSAQYRLGKIGIAQGRLETAVNRFSLVTEGPLVSEALYNLGMVFFSQKNWKGTVRSFSSLLGNHPSSARIVQARYVLGVAHYKLGEAAAAVKLLEQYLRSGDRGRMESLWAHAFTGEVYQRRGQCSTAKRHFEVVLKEDIRFPPRAGSVIGLADCYYRKKDFVSAGKYYDLYFQDYAGSPQSTLARIRAGHSHLLAGRYRKALENLQQVKKENVPDDYGQWVMYWTARSQDLSGNQVIALKTYEALVSSYPQGVPALKAAGKAAEMRFSKKEYEGAIEQLAILRKSNDSAISNWALRMTGESQYGLGRYDEAFAVFEKVLPKIQDGKVRKVILRKLAISAFRTRNNPEALRYLNWWLEAERSSSHMEVQKWPTRRFEALNFLAIVQTKLGMLNEVAKTWRDLEVEVPNDQNKNSKAQKAEFSANRGLVLFRLKDYPSAVTQFHNWLGKYFGEKNRPKVLLYLGLAELEMGKNSDAIGHLKTFLKENPLHPKAREALYAAALGALRTNDYASSSELLSKWVVEAEEQSNPERLKEGWFLLAASRFASTDWKGAAKAYHLLLERYSIVKRRKMILGKLESIYDHLTGKDGIEATLKWIATHVPRFPQKGEIFLRLGRKYLSLKNKDRALELFQVAASSRNSKINGGANFRLARILVDKGKHQEALLVLEQIPGSVFSVAEWRAEAEFLRGVAYEGQKEWDKAVQAYRLAARQTSSPDIAGKAVRRISRIETVRLKL